MDRANYKQKEWLQKKLGEENLNILLEKGMLSEGNRHEFGKEACRIAWEIGPKPLRVDEEDMYSKKDWYAELKQMGGCQECSPPIGGGGGGQVVHRARAQGLANAQRLNSQAQSLLSSAAELRNAAEAQRLEEALGHECEAASSSLLSSAIELRNAAEVRRLEEAGDRGDEGR